MLNYITMGYKNMEATIYCNTSNATDGAFMVYAMVAISQGLLHSAVWGTA